jgi:hypothetical protein
MLQNVLPDMLFRWLFIASNPKNLFGTGILNGWVRLTARFRLEYLPSAHMGGRSNDT